jgi:cell division protein FtsI (penicillin-binding protein 3)
MSDRGIKCRIALTSIVLAVAIAGLGFRLAFLHLGEHQKVNRSIRRETLGGRGAIYDRRGRSNIIALNLPVKDVCVDPSEIARSNAVNSVATELSSLLGLNADDVAANLRKRSNKEFAYVKRFVPEETALALGARDITGVFFEDAVVRRYPHEQLMCHVLGFVNYQGVGCAGVEMTTEAYVKGSPGLLESRVDARRRELYLRRGRVIPALKGASVSLTLDQNIQYMAENALDKIMEEHKPKGAWAIVQKVRTGEILAMASRPNFNPNEFNKCQDDARMNRAVAYNYEPGSTMKAVVFAAALNEGLVSTDTIIDCEQGSWHYAGKPLRDSHSYGKLTVADGLKKSSNICAAKLALMLGSKRLDKYLRDFGIGSRLEIDLPGEEAGILASVDKWSKISPTRIAIGQGVAVTALQMLGLYCAVANDGFLMKPYVVKEIVTDGGEVIFSAEAEILSRPISAETAETMRALLARVTEDGGTGRRARVNGYKVAGKTGTAQKAIKGGYSQTQYVGSFVGFLPADNPEIAVIVVVDEPQPFHTGGRVAGPAFSDIAGQAARYLDVVPAGENSLASR